MAELYVPVDVLSVCQINSGVTFTGPYVPLPPPPPKKKLSPTRAMVLGSSVPLTFDYVTFILAKGSGAKRTKNKKYRFSNNFPCKYKYPSDNNQVAKIDHWNTDGKSTSYSAFLVAFCKYKRLACFYNSYCSCILGFSYRSTLLFLNSVVHARAATVLVDVAAYSL